MSSSRNTNMKKSILKKGNDGLELDLKPVKRPVPQASVTIEKKDKTKKPVDPVVVREKNILQLLYLKGVLKNKLEKLFHKYEKQKALKCENSKLLSYGDDLERCVMCFFRNGEILKHQIDNLYVKAEEDNADTKQNLKTDLDKNNLLLKQKENERDSLIKKDEEIREKIGNLSEKYESNILQRNHLRNQSDNLKCAIETLNEEIKLIEKKALQEIQYLSITLKENREMHEQELSDRKKKVTRLEKEFETIVEKKNELLSTIAKLSEKAEQSLKEKRQMIKKLESLIKISGDLEELKTRADQQLEECHEHVTEICKENVEYANIIKDGHDKLDSCKQERERIMLENSQIQERLCKLHENIGHNKRTIVALIKENNTLKEKKQVVDDMLQSKLDYEKELMDCTLNLRIEYEFLLANFYKFLNHLSSCESKTNKVKQQREELATLENISATSQIVEEGCLDSIEIQEKIALEYQNRIEFLKTMENLERITTDIDKEMSKKEAKNMQAVDEYNQVLENVNEFERRVIEKESDLLHLEEILKSKTRRIEYLKQNCTRMKDHLAAKEEALKNCVDDLEEICEENERLNLKIEHLECEIAEELSAGETYKNQVKVLTQEKTFIDEKLVELRQAKNRNSKLQGDNLDLVVRLNTLKSNYKTALDCSDNLLKIMEDQKERLEIQEGYGHDEEKYCVTYSCPECSQVSKNDTQWDQENKEDIWPFRPYE